MKDVNIKQNLTVFLVFSAILTASYWIMADPPDPIILALWLAVFLAVVGLLFYRKRHSS
jgi:hypothetical protein